MITYGDLKQGLVRVGVLASLVLIAVEFKKGILPSIDKTAFGHVSFCSLGGVKGTIQNEEKKLTTYAFVNYMLYNNVKF
jgi:thiaminase